MWNGQFGAALIENFTLYHRFYAFLQCYLFCVEKTTYRKRASTLFPGAENTLLFILICIILLCSLLLIFCVVLNAGKGPNSQPSEYVSGPSTHTSNNQSRYIRHF